MRAELSFASVTDKIKGENRLLSRPTNAVYAGLW